MHSPVIYERRFVRAYGIFALPRRLLLNGKKAEPILHSAGAVPFSEIESAATASLDVVGSLGRTKGEKIWPAAVVVVRSTTLGELRSAVFRLCYVCGIYVRSVLFYCILSVKALYNAVQLALYVALLLHFVCQSPTQCCPTDTLRSLCRRPRQCRTNPAIPFLR